MLFPPPPWTHAAIRLYHGTVLGDAEELVAAGVDVRRGRTRTDFGAGFYTTTLERQAKGWAHQRTRGARAEQAAVVAFDIDREQFGKLATLPFVRGDFDAEDFWSLVSTAGPVAGLMVFRAAQTACMTRW
jgi:hypothetical protein